MQNSVFMSTANRWEFEHESFWLRTHDLNQEATITVCLLCFIVFAGDTVNV